MAKKLTASFTTNRKKQRKQTQTKLTNVLKTGNPGTPLTDAERKVVRNNIMEQAPMLDSVPENIYHASPVKNHDSIVREGLKASEIFSDVYFTASEDQALQFVARPCYVYQVATKKLRQEWLRQSLDHSPFVYKDVECFVYFDDVPADAIVGCWYFV